ncbi:hypothetical protein QWY31_09205 [Cytophagales bacterium LB-30]|uniref:Uncharacterized protein n=1 Tax=Shiella aurantiaca TaxID=3058365 RepID=A0ABT8F5P2_9BACT|nr:hypothetical protein [Shiella aurantiaca]MDN4165679.1 hypothetical protein [Shiella aurantiaca]
MRNLLLFLIFFLSGLATKAQGQLEDIDLFKIPQQKIREFIAQQKANDIHFFSEIKASVYNFNESIHFRKHRRTYRLHDNTARVWEVYNMANPSESWKGKRVSFGLVCSKKDSALIYRNGAFNGLETGQVFYINVGVMAGLENLAVAFEIVTIDPENKIIEFSYVKGGKSEGIQRLQFIEKRNGHTKVIHTSLFKSDSYMRDRFLYPFFHSKVIKEYHKNMKRLIQA